jgi:diphthine-ammonia ligase
MSLFAPANAVYSTYFGTSPPSRATVAVPLPQGSRIRLEVVGYDDRLSPGLRSDAVRADRQALHVQGLSYWAPANIGPYSQAVIVSLSFLSRITSERRLADDR